MFSLPGPMIYTNGIRKVLDGLNLPVPGKGEAHSTSDKGKLLFITTHGCAVRLTPFDHISESTHPFFLRPLFSRYADGYRIDVNPGLNSPVSNSRALKLYLYLRKNGINISDPHRANFGFIPGTQFPLLLDVDKKEIAINYKKASFELAKNLQGIKKALGIKELGLKTHAVDPQDYYFGDLSAKFAKAWPAGQETPDRTMMAGAWEACRKAQEQGRLVAAWETYNYCGTSNSAKRYAKALEKPGFHLGL